MDRPGVCRAVCLSCLDPRWASGWWGPEDCALQSQISYCTRLVLAGWRLTARFASAWSTKRYGGEPALRRVQRRAPRFVGDPKLSR